MELDWFKNIPESYTVLVFGEVFDDRPPVTNNILFGQKAYEGFQVYVYLDALLRTRNHPTEVDWSPLFCALYAGIIATGAEQVVEMGSTLFATIDKLKKLERLANGPVLDLEYIGVEPSDFFCQVAEAIHPDSRIKHVKKLSDVTAGNSVSRSYQSTSYAFLTTGELIEYCAQSVFGSQGLWFSTDGKTRNVTVLGKSLTLFSVPEFVRGMQDRGYKVEFVANSKATRLNNFEYYETWLIYHKLDAKQQITFRDWLLKLSAVTQETPALYAEFDSVPVGIRKDAAFEGLEATRQFDFTSTEAVKRLRAWRVSQKVPKVLKRALNYMRTR